MSGKYNPTLVKLLLTSIDNVEMLRLKEGFYLIMKLANTVRDKGARVKTELIEFSATNKLEKPVTEPVLFLRKWEDDSGPAAASKTKPDIKIEMASSGMPGQVAKKKSHATFKKKL
jgi:hypothetical protein